LKNFGLSAKERIKKLSEFRKVFKEGRAILSLDKKLKVYYFLIKETDTTETKIAVTINKKNGNAVWRNRLRRLIKESYRLSKRELLLTCSKKKCSLYFIINPVGFNKNGYPKVKLIDIKNLVEDVLRKVIAEL
jgi:ribonuclease P protein component